MGSYLSRNNIEQQFEQTKQIIIENQGLFDKIGRANTYNDWNQYRCYIQIHLSETMSIKHLIDIPSDVIKRSIFYLPATINFDQIDSTIQFNLEEFIKVVTIEPIFKKFLCFFLIDGVFKDDDSLSNLVTKLTDYKVISPLFEFTFKILSQGNDYVSEHKIKELIDILIKSDKNRWIQMTIGRYIDETGNFISKEKYKIYFMDTVDFTVVSAKLITLQKFQKDNIPFELLDVQQKVFDFLKQKLIGICDEMVDESFFIINETRSKNTISREDFLNSLTDQRFQSYIKTFANFKLKNFKELVDKFADENL